MCHSFLFYFSFSSRNCPYSWSFCSFHNKTSLFLFRLSFRYKSGCRSFSDLHNPSEPVLSPPSAPRRIRFKHEAVELPAGWWHFHLMFTFSWNCSWIAGRGRVSASVSSQPLCVCLTVYNEAGVSDQLPSHCLSLLAGDLLFLISRFPLWLADKCHFVGAPQVAAFSFPAGNGFSAHLHRQWSNSRPLYSHWFLSAAQILQKRRAGAIVRVTFRRSVNITCFPQKCVVLTLEVKKSLSFPLDVWKTSKFPVESCFCLTSGQS